MTNINPNSPALRRAPYITIGKAPAWCNLSSQALISQMPSARYNVVADPDQRLVTLEFVDNGQFLVSKSGHSCWALPGVRQTVRNIVGGLRGRLIARIEGCRILLNLNEVTPL